MGDTKNDGGGVPIPREFSGVLGQNKSIIVGGPIPVRIDNSDSGNPFFSPWIMETFSGIAFNLRDPDPLQVNIIDIAHHLAAIGRYCGAAKSFYSVAQHSVLVSQLVWRQTKSDPLAKAALLHDAHEAYIGDWTRPLCEAYPELKPIRRRVASRLDLAIAKALGVDAGDFHHPIVIDADNSMLMAEANELMPSKGEGWGLADVKPAEVRVIFPLSSHNAKIYFLDAWSVMQ